MTKVQRPPNANEFELSLFGPGVGECAVVHLGNGEWIVVDSCIDRDSGNPVALDYFERLAINPSVAIRSIIISHWHDDHIRGIASIAKAAPDATIILSMALNIKEFNQVLGATVIPYMKDAGIDEMKEIFELLVERTQGRKTDAAPIWAKANTLVYQSSVSTVKALSPSDAVFTRFLQEIGNLIPSQGKPARRAVSNTPNEIAVAIWIECGGIRALLGSDLEKGDTPITGWQAIVNSPLRPQSKAHIIKVPHHGSIGANEDRVWSDLMEPQPVAILTPFRRSSIPNAKDQTRISSKSGSAYCTAPPHATRPTPRIPVVQKMVRRVAPDLREVVGGMGHVRLRSMRTSPTPKVELFGPAFQF